MFTNPTQINVLLFDQPWTTKLYLNQAQIHNLRSDPFTLDVFFDVNSNEIYEHGRDIHLKYLIDTEISKEGFNIVMTSRRSLEAFLQYCQTKYPVKHYALFLGGHGGGIYGGLLSQASKALSVSEIREAIENGLGGKRLDFIGYDACLMATVEQFQEMAPVANVMVASELTEVMHPMWQLYGWKMGQGRRKKIIIPFSLSNITLQAHP